MRPTEPAMNLNSEASDLGWGGTVLKREKEPIYAGEHEIQGIWDPTEQSRTIMWRELLGMIYNLELAADTEDMMGRTPRDYLQIL